MTQQHVAPASGSSDSDVSSEVQIARVALDVAGMLAILAQDFDERSSVEHVLQTIIHAAIDNIPGVAWATITAQTPHGFKVRSASDDAVKRIDELQGAAGEGPSLSSLTTCTTVRLDDVNRDGRWPDWADPARSVGINSVLCFCMARGRNRSGLNLYAREPASFDAAAENLGELLAIHAAIALAGAEEVAQLNAALNSRDVIARAKGILMERHDLTDHAAFELLVRASQTTRIRLVDVAIKIARRD